MFISQALLEPYYKDKKKLASDLELAGKSSAEDKSLFEWLIADDEVWPVLAPVFERRLNSRKGLGAWLLEADHVDFKLGRDQKRVGSFFIILELREYAGHTLWNKIQSPPHYDHIIKAVHERVAKRFKKPFPETMSALDREINLSAILLSESMDQLTPETVERILKESNFTSASDYAEIRKTFLNKVRGGGGGFSSFKSTLGKSVAKRFGVALIESAWGASKLSAAGRIGSLASKVLPFALRRAGLYLSLGFLLKDAYQLGGEATRVTNPAVIIISLYRSLSD